MYIGVPRRMSLVSRSASVPDDFVGVDKNLLIFTNIFTKFQNGSSS